MGHFKGHVTDVYDIADPLNVEPDEPPGHIVPPFSISFCTRESNGHSLAVADEEGYVTVIDTSKSCRTKRSSTLIHQVCL